MDGQQTEKRAERLSKLLEAVHNRMVFIRRGFDGMPWLNVLLLTPSEFTTKSLCAVNPTTGKRLGKLFILGLSLSSLLSIPEQENFLSAVAQLMEEFDHYYDSEGKSQNVLMTTPTTTSSSMAMSFGLGRNTETLKGKLRTSGSYIIYEFLKVLSIPFEDKLDFATVVLTLCDILDQAYMKICQGTTDPSKGYLDAATKFDHKINKYFFEFVLKLLSEISTNVVQTELSDLGSVVALNRSRKSMN